MQGIQHTEALGTAGDAAARARPMQKVRPRACLKSGRSGGRALPYGKAKRGVLPTCPRGAVWTLPPPRVGTLRRSVCAGRNRTPRRGVPTCSGYRAAVTRYADGSLAGCIWFTGFLRRITVSLPVMLNAIEFTLNGRSVRVEDVSPNTTLLEYLRGAGLTGAKEGCAEGDCGACSVAIVDRDSQGRPCYRAINSCLVPLVPDGRTRNRQRGRCRRPGQAAPRPGEDGGGPRLAMRLLHAGLRHVALRGLLPRGHSGAGPA